MSARSSRRAPRPRDGSKSSTIAVIGAGRMGRGIAQTYALAGISSVLVDLKRRPAADRESFAEVTRKEIRTDLESLRGAGLMSTQVLRSALRRISVIDAPCAAELIGCMPLIFEAVPETAGAKRRALQWIGKYAAAEATVASTTSTLGVGTLSKYIVHPARFLNAHWLNPATLMPLIEVSASRYTDKRVVAHLVNSLSALGKIPIPCADSPGYIVPRIQALAMNEAARLVEERVAGPSDIDLAVRVGFGIRFAVLGLLEFIDWGGNDILYRASRHLAKTVGQARYRPPKIVRDNMKSGRNGLREGRGFFDYRHADVRNYRRDRLARFIGLLRHLELMPVIAAVRE